MTNIHKQMKKKERKREKKLSKKKKIIVWSSSTTDDTEKKGYRGFETKLTRKGKRLVCFGMSHCLTGIPVLKFSQSDVALSDWLVVSSSKKVSLKNFYHLKNLLVFGQKI